MNALYPLQHDFQDYLCCSEKKILDEIVSTEKVSAEERLSVYENAYWSRLIDALATTYPVLEAYIGSSEFMILAKAYIHSYPSSFRSIRWFGDKFAQFLQTQALAQQNPFLIELAMVEWTMTLVFDAPDKEPIAMTALQSISPESWANIGFQFHPSLHCLNFSWNVMAIWKALSNDEDPPPPIQENQVTHWLFWRHGLEEQYCALSEKDAYAIKTMQNGALFSELCEGVCQWVKVQDAPIEAASLLKGWIIEGLVVGIQNV